MRGDLSYRVSGNRGTRALVTFNCQKGWAGLVDDPNDMGFAIDFDDRSLTLDANGDLQNEVKAKVGINTFLHQTFPRGGLSM